MARQEVAPHECKNVPKLPDLLPIEASEDALPALLSPGLGARFEALQQQALGLQRQLNMGTIPLQRQVARSITTPPFENTNNARPGSGRFRELALMSVLLQNVAYELPEGSPRSSILGMLNEVFQRNAKTTPAASEPAAVIPEVSMSPIAPLPSPPLVKEAAKEGDTKMKKRRKCKASKQEGSSPASVEPDRSQRQDFAKLLKDYPMPPSPPGCQVDKTRRMQRWKQVVLGLSTAGYKNMERCCRATGGPLFEPPSIFEDTSKRAFERALREWRRKLHCFDDVENTSESEKAREGSSDDGQQAEDTPGDADCEDEETEVERRQESAPAVVHFASTMPVVEADVSECGYSKSVG